MTKDTNFADGTTIGNVNVAGKSLSDSLALLKERLAKWEAGTTITIHYKEKTVQMDTELYSFNLEKSIQAAKQGTKNNVIVHIADGDINNMLRSISPSITASNVDIKKLHNDLLANASLLEASKYEIQLRKYINGENNNDQVVNEAVVKLANANKELQELLASPLKIEFPSQNQFSLLKFMEKKNNSISAETNSMIATSLYNVILPTNIEIIERNISKQLPSYATLGFEAKVDRETNTDFVIANPNDFPFYVELSLQNGNLYAALKGTKLLNKYTISVKDKETFKPKTIKQFHPQLAPTQTIVKQVGQEGLLVKVYRTTNDERGSFIREDLIAEDFYPPAYRVEITGLKVPETKKTDSTKKDQNSTDPNNKQKPSPSSKDPSQENGTKDTKDPKEPNKQPESDIWGKPNETTK